MRAARLAIALILLSPTSGRSQAVTFAAGNFARIAFQPNTALAHRTVARLAEYLGTVLGKPAQIGAQIETAPAGTPLFVLSANGKEPASGVTAPAGSPEAFALETRTVAGHPLVVAVGNTDLGLKRAVQRLILASEQRAPGLVMPELHVAEQPWIPKREWALCPWVPQSVRGVFSNPNADPRLDVYLYSDSQIANYVAMYDSFGFSGCQLLEACSTFHDHGSPEAAQDVLRRYARAAHAQGQEVTYWVWAAQFNSYGWVDPSVVYTPRKGTTAFEDPKVRAAFEKYYDHYAQMAPDVDRLVAHFYDPGSLTSREDVFSYLGLLQAKFKAKNPKIQLGVDLWAVSQNHAAADYMQQLTDHGFGDTLMLETSMPSYWPPGRREALHTEARRRGLNLGIWGWYTTDMETDQMPAMHVNAHLLSQFYRQVKNGADRIRPITYWSEMEAYHLNDIFTMYASAQLLWNPERDPDGILREIAVGIYGPHNGEPVFRALKLIEDVRTGPSWDTYWRHLRTYRLGTDDPESDLRRADAAIEAFEAMKPDAGFVPKFPLPFPPSAFIELTLPHLREIRQFADFRVKVAAIRAAAKNGASKADLTRLVQAAWQPVPDYNTWIGVWGQLEAVTQEEIVEQLCEELGIAVPAPGPLRFREAERLVQAIQNRQRFSASPWRFGGDGKILRSGSGFMLWPERKFRDRLSLLIESGAVEKTEKGLYQLADWGEFRLR
jgi:hypothetical protein